MHAGTIRPHPLGQGEAIPLARLPHIAEDKVNLRRVRFEDDEWPRSPSRLPPRPKPLLVHQLEASHRSSGFAVISVPGALVTWVFRIETTRLSLDKIGTQ